MQKVNGLVMFDPAPIAEEGECPGGRYWYLDRPEEAIPLLRHWAASEAWAAIDLETSAGWQCGPSGAVFTGHSEPRTSTIFLCSVSTEPGSAVVFDMRALMRDTEFYQAFQEFLQRCRLVAHNAYFESIFLLHQFRVMPAIAFDTFLVSKVLNAGKLDTGNALGDVMERYTGLTLDKKWQKFFLKIHPESPIPEEAIRYSAGDVCQLLNIARQMDEELNGSGCSHIYWEIEQPFLPIVVRAHDRGIGIDVPALQEIRSDYAARVRDLESDFTGIVGWQGRTQNKLRLDPETGKRKRVSVTWEEPAVNMASPKQLLAWYQDRGIEIQSTGETALKGLLQTRLPDEVRRLTQTVLDYRAVSKILATYCEPLLEDHLHPLTWKIHTTWKSCHAETGRMASERPNCQNIPPNIRAVFCAEPGHKLIILDYSQFELRVLAALSNEPLMVKAFQEGLDLHGQTAAGLFGQGYTSAQRKIAKVFNFAIAYGATPRALAIQASISEEEAYKLYDRFFDTYRILKRYLDMSALQAQTNLVSVTPAGRKRFFNRPDLTAENYRAQVAAIGREGVNAVIQGYNADSLKAACIAYDGCRHPDSHLVLFVHDEIVAECPERHVDVETEKLKRCMIDAARKYIQNVPFEVSAAVSDRWIKD